LIEVVDQIGTDNWTSVAELMDEKFGIKDRSGKKCRERWINHLKPDVSKSPWSEDEMKTLFRSQAFYGNQWTEIAKFLPGRTDNSVKNFFYTTLRKKIRLFNKSCLPDDMILISVNDVSLNPDITRKVLQVPNRKESAKVSTRYFFI
jgi:predicted nucleotidyltransferase